MDFVELQAAETKTLTSVTLAFSLSLLDFREHIKAIYMRVIDAFANWAGHYSFVTRTNAHIKKLLDPVAKAIKEHVVSCLHAQYSADPSKCDMTVAAVEKILADVRKKANKWFNTLYGPVFRAERERLDTLLAQQQAKLAELEEKEKELSQVRLHKHMPTTVVLSLCVFNFLCCLAATRGRGARGRGAWLGRNGSLLSWPGLCVCANPVHPR